jgi:hypothetical protein
MKKDSEQIALSPFFVFPMSPSDTRCPLLDEVLDIIDHHGSDTVAIS